MNTLLVDCDDTKGLIYKISKILFENNFNIVSNREFVDRDKNHFYMRTRFTGELENEDILLKELKAVLPEKANINIPKNKKKKVIIFVSHEYHCFSELVLRNAYNEIDMEIVAVIGNHKDLKNLAEKFGLPYFYIDKTGKTRGEFESDIIEIVNKFEMDFMVLAKFMQILSKDFVEKYHYKIINIHHSFLPAFVGANPYKQAHDRGVKIIGATAHFVTDQLDEGQIILQNVARVSHKNDINSMRQIGRDIEKNTLTNALKLVCEDKVFLNGNKTIVFD